MPQSTTRVAHRVAGMLGGVALVAAIALAGAPASAAPGDEHLVGLEYVALGDSYASGFGLGSYSTTPHLECDQSTLNYPHLVATEFGLNLTDVSCSGATMEHITTTGQVLSSTTVLPQVDALSASTDIVTLTIGGNDVGFVTVMTGCAALTAGGPVLGDLSKFTCEEIFAPGGVDSLAAMIVGPVASDLVATLTAIKGHAPNAKIFLIGYPALTPDAASVPAGIEGCFRTALGAPFPPDAYPYTPTDVTYLHSVESTLDSMYSAMATSQGVTYVSMFDATSAHSPCAALPDQYVNGVTVISADLGAGTAVLAPGAFHPNTAGVAFMTTQVESAIRAEFPVPPVDPGAAPDLAATGADSGFLGVLGLVGIFAMLAGSVALRIRTRGWLTTSRDTLK